MSEALVLRPTEQSLSISEVVARAQAIESVMKTLMVENVHYGKIPGTPKPSLWQPGAEKLLLMFQLDPELEVEDLSEPDEARFRVLVRVRHIPTGNLVGSGVGECSSHEEKYKWRRAVCDQEFDETPFDRRREKWQKGKNDSVYQVKQVRTERSDMSNTVLKMAKKRALVDAAKSSTGASDIFDQDLEDLDIIPGEPTRTVGTPTAKKAEAATAPSSSPSNGTLFGSGIPDEAWQEIKDGWIDGDVISVPQGKRLFAIAHKQGWSFKQVAEVLAAKLGVKELGEGDERVLGIPKGTTYEKVCKVFESFAP